MANPSPKAFALASHFIPKTAKDQSPNKSIAWQMDHRLELLKFWDIKPGSRVLELGCGQGDCTIPLADAVGEKGHIDAIDPGSPDYGSPLTLSQSQAIIKSHSLGNRITFLLSTSPIDFLSCLPHATPPLYDYIILSHCIWYFESPSMLTTLIQTCSSFTTHLCIAEWSLRASIPAALPHVLTALLLGNLEAHRSVATDVNIRSVLSPREIISIVSSTSSSFRFLREQTSITNEGMLDGYWETSYCLRTREKVLGRLVEQGIGEKQLGALKAMYDAVESSVSLLDVPDGVEQVKGVRSMDFWVGVFIIG